MGSDLAGGQEENKQDDDIYFDEEESEEQWRKQRHEREMFLKQHQQKTQDMDDLLGSSQLLQIGQKILQKGQNSQNTTPAEKNNADESPFKNTPFNIQVNWWLFYYLPQLTSCVSFRTNVVHFWTEATKFWTAWPNSLKWFQRSTSIRRKQPNTSCFKAFLWRHHRRPQR